MTYVSSGTLNPTHSHPSGVAKPSTSFGWGKGGKGAAAGWQVTLGALKTREWKMQEWKMQE